MASTESPLVCSVSSRRQLQSPRRTSPRSIAMATATALHVAPTTNGCVIRVEGRGTMKESPAARAVAMQTLSAEPTTSVVVDLNSCDYLDSTFLGCLAQMYNRFDLHEPKRFF